MRDFFLDTILMTLFCFAYYELIGFELLLLFDNMFSIAFLAHDFPVFPFDLP